MIRSDFSRDVSALRNFAYSSSKSGWILHSENLYLFAVAFVGILQAKKTLYLTANIQSEFIKEISSAEKGILFEKDIRSILDSQLRESNDETLSIDLQSDIILYTSGTTGEPKAVHKKYAQLDAECQVLADLWGNESKNCLFCRTVSNHHIYGLLFSFLLPLKLGAQFRENRIENFEELAALQGGIVLISSPAFLKRITDKSRFSQLKICSLFSSGGVLPFDSAKNVEKILGEWATEIYGSTETGGIAHRQSKNGLEWTPFSVCDISLDENGCLRVKSPYIAEENWFTTGDLAEFLQNGKFLLKGRADSIVKIEEKRISLPEVETRIRSSNLVQDVCVVAFNGARQYLAAAVVLNKNGVDKFFGSSNSQKNLFFRKYLSDFLEGVVIPRKWRYMDALPQDSLGKIKRREIEALFENIKNLVIISLEKSENEALCISAELIFPQNSDFFDGHFPDFQLLPAVAQVDTAIKISHKYLKSPKCIGTISRAKFSKPIRPNAKVRLNIRYREKEKTISFEYSAKGESYSKGTLLFR